MRLRVPVVCLLFTALVGGVSAAADPHFDLIEPLGAGASIEPLSVSADGCSVVGHSSFEAIRWRDGVTTQLRTLTSNPQIAYAITPDGQVVVGYAGHHFFRLDEPDYQLLDVPGGAGNPTEARAVSADGQSAGGCTHAATDGQHCDWPFFWRAATGSVLLNGPSGGIEIGAVEALSADGSVAAGAAGGQALIWHPDAGTVQGLGTLPGHSSSAAFDLTPDATIAVGTSRSGPSSSRRAFRWTAASGMVDLGPETRVAHAISADGLRIVGEGPNGAFIWDAGRGARPLGTVLRDEYGLDLGAFEPFTATAISADGKTIVGKGSLGGELRGFRARLREEPCWPEPVATDLLAGYAGQPELDAASRLATDSQRAST
jgi:hypothetical protein